MMGVAGMEPARVEGSVRGMGRRKRVSSGRSLGPWMMPTTRLMGPLDGLEWKRHETLQTPERVPRSSGRCGRACILCRRNVMEVARKKERKKKGCLLFDPVTGGSARPRL